MYLEVQPQNSFSLFNKRAGEISAIVASWDGIGGGKWNFVSLQFWKLRSLPIAPTSSRNAQLGCNSERGTECIGYSALSLITKAGIFDAGFGEIMRSRLLQWAEKHKFQPDSRKRGVTDPSLTYYESYS